MPRSANVEHYARIVREKDVLRELIRAQPGDPAVARSPPAARTEELLDDAEKAIFRVAEKRLRAGFIPLRVAAEESLQVDRGADRSARS